MQDFNWNNVPWSVLLTLVLVGCGVVLVLIKDKMRRPDTFVTTREVEAEKKEIINSMGHLEEQFRELRAEVKEWETEYRKSCATLLDVNALGRKVDEQDKRISLLAAVANDAKTDSATALMKVSHLQEDVRRLENAISEIAKKIDPIPVSITELKGQLSLLLTYFADKKG